MTKLLTTDDTLQIYQARDLNSNVIARLPSNLEIQLGEIIVFEGREWIEVAVESGVTGYVLGPSARGHTTFGSMKVIAPLSSVDQALKEIVAGQQAPRVKRGSRTNGVGGAGGLIGAAAAWWFL